MNFRQPYVLCINILVFCLGSVAWAQDKKVNPYDTLTIRDRYGLRLGVDLFKPARTALEDNFTGFEVVADYRLTKKHWLAFEAGFDDRTRNDDNINTTVEGAYIKGGFDYNLHNNWLGMENQIYVGLRVGVSSFSNTLNSFTILSNDPFFGETTVAPGTEFDGLSASWGEALLGLRFEALPNIYVNMNVQFKRIINNTDPPGFKNFHIPGFNEVNDFGEFGFGFSYSVSYFIPFYQRTREKATGNKK